MIACNSSANRQHRQSLEERCVIVIFTKSPKKKRLFPLLLCHLHTVFKSRLHPRSQFSVDYRITGRMLRQSSWIREPVEVDSTYRSLVPHWKFHWPMEKKVTQELKIDFMVNTHTHTHARARARAHKRSLSHSHTHTQTLTHTYTHTLTYQSVFEAMMT